MRVVVIDDNPFERHGLVALLQEQDGVEVVANLSQDKAVAAGDDEFGEIDVAFVEVVDEDAQCEVGTDLYSGISAIERLSPLAVATIAMVPNSLHPLVHQWLFEAGTDFAYHRHEVMDPERLARALVAPDEAHRVRPVDSAVLDSYGAKTARLQEAVRVLEASGFHGFLSDDVDASDLYAQDIVQRNDTRKFVKGITAIDFDGEPEVRSADVKVGFPQVKKFVVSIIGVRHKIPGRRKDAK